MKKLLNIFQRNKRVGKQDPGILNLNEKKEILMTDPPRNTETAEESKDSKDSGKEARR